MDCKAPLSIPPGSKIEVDMILIKTAQLCDFQGSAMSIWHHSRRTLNEGTNSSRDEVTLVFKEDFDVPLLF